MFFFSLLSVFVFADVAISTGKKIRKFVRRSFKAPSLYTNTQAVFLFWSRNSTATSINADYMLEFVCYTICS